ncbi:MAG: hypothetical protein IJJ76_06135 [Ruminococcus sp.]|uniref:immunity protein Imm33 domain-containing protein n=1 Tax=Ruminococcus sp. TaxID=41978 RepID=UPI0025CDE5DC|nr:hypothetical protein [Ruminococcus sp.]MBR0529333.1 hypothetical protein [Ruminococcus sp.]
MNEYIETINGIKYYLKAESVIYFQSESLLKVIKKIPVSEIHDNYKLEIGFSLYILRKRESEDAYDICVPDYKKSPFTDVTDDLTLAFLIQLEQITVLQKYNLSGASVRFDDEILVSKDSLTKSTICLQRFRDLKGSGWCINEIIQDQDGSFMNTNSGEYEMIYAYQLLSMRPSILNVLFLPYDYIAVFKDDDCIEILDDNNNSIMESDD